MASSNHVTEKPFAPQNQQVLKCPRCNSSNTKFCYYNNYSLSQPRHFCKACKRYWTRGGTLRNVPVGGGCRKNKKIKRSTSSTTTTTIGHNPNPNPNPNLDDHSTSLNNINPLYGNLLHQNPKYPRFNTDVSRYDLVHPHMSSLGLGFSSSLTSSYPSMFNGGSTSSDPMMASLLASSLHQQPRFMGFTPYGDDGGSLVTDVHIEGTKTGENWSNNFNGQNDNDHIKSVEFSDPTSFLWTTTGGDGGEWLDPTSNICSSVPSLI